MRSTGPDARAWARVSLGMTAAEVETLVGPPSLRTELVGGWSGVYGEVEVDSGALVRLYPYELRFDERDCVWLRADPHDGALSCAGLPTEPRLVAPSPGTDYSHGTREFDVRWTIPAGLFPMEFDVECEYSCDGTNYMCLRVVDDTSGNHTVIRPPGVGVVRVRVRGVNALGRGPWSRRTQVRLLR